MKRTPLPKRTSAPNRKRSGPPRRGRVHDPEYLAWIREQPCVVTFCKIPRSEAAHVGEIRGLGQKCSDHETIPLCVWHHGPEGPQSHHRLGKGFWPFWGLDRDALIAEYRERYLEETGVQATRD